MRQLLSIFGAILVMANAAVAQTNSQLSSDFQQVFLNLGLATVTAAISDGTEAAKGNCPSATSGEFSKATGRLKQLRDENLSLAMKTNPIDPVMTARQQIYRNHAETTEEALANSYLDFADMLLKVSKCFDTADHYYRETLSTSARLDPKLLLRAKVGIDDVRAKRQNK